MVIQLTWRLLRQVGGSESASEFDVEIGLQPQATPMLVNVGLNEREY